MTTVLVGDRRDLVSAGLQALIRDAGYTVVGCCGNAVSLARALETSPPNLLILSQGLFQISKTVVREHLRGRNHPLQIVVLFEDPCQSTLSEVVSFGAQGLILNVTAADRLLECIRQVCIGERWIDPNLLPCLLHGAPHASSMRLSLREMEIAHLVSHGLRNKEIAHRMNIAEGTVKMHLHHIYEKLQITSRTELALIARSTLELPPRFVPDLPQQMMAEALPNREEETAF